MIKSFNLYKYFPYKNMNHHEILLYGFHITFFFIFPLAIMRDIYFSNYFNAGVNSLTLSLSILSYYLLHYKQKIKLASYIIILVAVIPLYILIYFNHFSNLVIIYVVLLPLAPFFLLDLKPALFVNFFMYLLLIVMLYYISIVNPSNTLLNNPLALINIVFASMFIVSFGILYHLSIETSLRKLIHSNMQKDILLKEVHHRVKNNLNVIASILGLQADGKIQEIQDELFRSKSRIESISIVHEMLYKQDDFEEIVFNQYVLKLKNLLLSMHRVDAKVEVELTNNHNLTLPLNIMIQFGLIINEMLTNSLKYAKNIDGVVIDISLEQENNEFVFTYRDNGEKKIDNNDLTLSGGLGFRLIDLNVKQLDGELKKYCDDGLCYEVRFKDV